MATENDSAPTVQLQEAKKHHIHTPGVLLNRVGVSTSTNPGEQTEHAERREN